MLHVVKGNREKIVQGRTTLPPPELFVQARRDLIELVLGLHKGLKLD